MSDLERNKAAVREFIQVVWNEGAFDRLDAFWTEDCVNHAAPPGANHGLAALRAYHDQIIAAFAGFSAASIAILQQIAEADRVVSQIVTTARHTGPFLGVAATGRSVALSTIRIDRLRDGRIAEHWSIANMAGLMQQLQG